MIEVDLNSRFPSVSREGVRDRTAAVLDETATYLLVGAAFILPYAGLDLALKLVGYLMGDAAVTDPLENPLDWFVLEPLAVGDVSLLLIVFLMVAMAFNDRSRDRLGYALLIPQGIALSALFHGIEELFSTLSDVTNPSYEHVAERVAKEGLFPYLWSQVSMALEKGVALGLVIGIALVLFVATHRFVMRRVDG